MADIVKQQSRIKRAKRIRFKVKKGHDRPRLCVHRSNKNIFVQIIDDSSGKTLCAASTLEKGLRKKTGDAFNKDIARDVGRRIANKAKEQNIGKVVFDRGPYLFHGKIKALADGAREEGLEF
jgi:large subunit ribosomal protein L18